MLISNKIRPCVILATDELSIQSFDPDFKNIPIIATERGALFALKNEIKPIACMGDFDSVNTSEYNNIQQNIPNTNKMSWNKDKTDVQACLDFAIKNKFNQFHIFTKSGYRWDQTYSNLNYLIIHKDMDIILYSKHNRVFKLKPGDNKIYSTKKYISFFCFDKDILNSKGLFWEFNNLPITKNHPGFSSNQLKNTYKTNQFIITCKTGNTLFIESDD